MGVGKNEREGGRKEERIRGKAEFREREVGMKARRREGRGKNEKRERERRQKVKVSGGSQVGSLT